MADKFKYTGPLTSTPARRLKRAYRAAKAQGDANSLKEFAKRLSKADGGYRQASPNDARIWIDRKVIV